MKAVLAFLVACMGLVSMASADNYAVLICGSSGYMNYRHHADVCHAYHILINHGIPADNIITFLYDDVAQSSQNPFPGKLFNKPTAAGTPGKDVYGGCVKDYTGSTVTVTNVENVLKGNAAAMKGIGTGRVLKSGPNDHVFVNFVDHGGPGLIALPSGPYWYKDQFTATLKAMHTSNMFSDLVFYMEACESGSMFDDTTASLDIYATTAADASQSSWGTYCPPDDMVDGKNINSCLGDLYSVNWMQNSDSPAFAHENFEQQYTLVKKETNRSQVMQFGVTNVRNDPLADFQGDATRVPSHRMLRAVHPEAVSLRPSEAKQVSSRDASLVSLKAQYTAMLHDTDADADAVENMRQTVEAAVLAQIKADAVFPEIARRRFGEDAVEKYMSVSLPQTHWDCYRQLNTLVEEVCGKYDDYSLQYARVANNLCVFSDGDASVHVEDIRSVCGSYN